MIWRMAGKLLTHSVGINPGLFLPGVTGWWRVYCREVQSPTWCWTNAWPRCIWLLGRNQRKVSGALKCSCRTALIQTSGQGADKNHLLLSFFFSFHHSSFFSFTSVNRAFKGIEFVLCYPFFGGEVVCLLWTLYHVLKLSIMVPLCAVCSSGLEMIWLQYTSQRYGAAIRTSNSC